MVLDDNARPHPNLLPRGEGTALGHCWQSLRALFAVTAVRTSLPGHARFTKARTTSLPLPGGEGRGEGERFIWLNTEKIARITLEHPHRDNIVWIVDNISE